jgi:hypothetical protein
MATFGSSKLSSPAKYDFDASVARLDSKGTF